MATGTSAPHNQQDEPFADPGRDEAPAEQLDRNQTELMTELRVAGAGVQVLFGFLLIVPFNKGWSDVSPFERDVYFVALICVAVAAVLLIAPMVHHRLLFREGEKSYLVRIGNRIAIVAMVFLSVGLIAILVLISSVVLGGAAPMIVGILAAAAIGWLWFGVALLKREHR